MIILGFEIRWVGLKKGICLLTEKQQTDAMIKEVWLKNDKSMIQAIKAYRSVSNCGLKEGRDYCLDLVKKWEDVETHRGYGGYGV